MMMRHLLVALVLLIASASAQSICEKYFGNNGNDQAGNMTNVINQVFSALLANSATAGFFNGANPGSINFTAPANQNALATLAGHLVQFFGAAIGCTGAGFPSYTGNPNMNLVHTFQTPVDKAAYENFNQAVLNVLRQDGVVQDDLFAIAQVLDQFRTGSGNSQNQICQARDCTTSPYTVLVGATTPGSSQNFFNPPYYTVPKGNTVNWILNNAVHTVTQAQGTSVAQRCAEASKGFNHKFSSSNKSFTHVVSSDQGTFVPYYCMFHCSAPSGEIMYAELEVVAPRTDSVASI
jgi:plastocyanin